MKNKKEFLSCEIECLYIEYLIESIWANQYEVWHYQNPCFWNELAKESKKNAEKIYDQIIKKLHEEASKGNIYAKCLVKAEKLEKEKDITDAFLEAWRYYWKAKCGNLEAEETLLYLAEKI